jgi:hypothetical protein
MIQAAGNNLVAEDCRRRFEAVLAFEFPNDAAVIFVQAVNVTVGGRKVNAIIFD